MKRVALVQPGSGKVFEFAEDRVADALRRGYSHLKPKPAPAARKPKSGKSKRK